MKFKQYLLVAIIFLPFLVIGQQPGDTIVVQSFDYNSTTRDSVASFPDGNLTYEKIIMEYNMRCKGALVSTSTDRNKGCGEWDYSCNTYLVDSSRIEKVESVHPNYIISNYDGEVFDYTTVPTFDYYDYTQQVVTIEDVSNKEEFFIFNGDDKDDFSMKADENSGRTLTIYPASDLTAAGFTAGAIDAIQLSVVNDGGQVNFLKVLAKQSSETTLDNTNPDLEGFTQLYNSNYTFYGGINVIPFTEPFIWDGVSSITFQFSFTNTSSLTQVELQATASNEVSSIYSFNNYVLDLSQNGSVVINQPELEQIENELTVAFWSYGDADVLPANTTVLYGYDTNPNDRDLNVHLPWSNGSVFFDCGYSGGYDRISKSASSSNYSGQWNHWAFVKNAATGSMKMYLNGSLWTSSTGNTRMIHLMNMVLGGDHNGGNNYKGKVNNLSIWNKELPANEIEEWMNITITDQHPSYDNLVAYYPISEGSGQVLEEAITTSMASGKNLFWTFERGETISRSFRAATLRPNITFLRGDYDLTIVNMVVRDSIMRIPNSINKYYIESNEGELKHDEVILESNQLLFSTDAQIVYDGENGEILETIPVVVEGSLTIEDLPYLRRFPFYNEMLSFVTPYGIGLDFGEKGKSWFFDVTDFTPLLKGDKRLTMQLGGQWQEEIDIKFYFIVGTPPRDVVEFNQLWQGTNRTGAARIAAINDDSRYAPLEVAIHADGEYYKLQSTITGHGSEGEFEQNGGEVLHFINIDGDFDENLWDLNSECSENPVFPQGGTWLTDRQGWCPGERSKSEILDVTEFLTPGQSAIFDYNCSEPFASGDFRYHISHQLVTYGAANHQLDVAIMDVKAPSDKVLYSRKNPVCANPIVTIQNTGEQDVEEIVIEYWVNEGSLKMTHTWTGSLLFLDEIDIQLETGTSFYDVDEAAQNVFYAEIKSVNGQSDDYEHNDTYRSPFNLTSVLPDQFIIHARTNNNSNENSYELFDDQGQLILAHALPASNTLYVDTFEISGCFKLVVKDSGDDGLTWWANPSQGSGYVLFRDMSGQKIQEFNSDFGGGFEFSFATESFVGTDDITWTPDVKIYPNPTSGIFTIKGIDDDEVKIELLDMLGQRIAVAPMKIGDFIQIDGSELQSGIYFVQIAKGTSQLVRKVVVE